MSDELQTAATIASLRKQVDELREETANLRVRLERSETVLESTRHSIITACTGTKCLNAHELRGALDNARYECASLAEEVDRTKRMLTRERERAGVLEREVRASRQPVGIDRVGWDHALQSARDETDRTQAIDAAKFDQHKRGSIIECLDKVREAGGKAWDNVANPDAVLRGDDDAAKFGGA